MMFARKRLPSSVSTNVSSSPVFRGCGWILPLLKQCCLGLWVVILVALYLVIWWRLLSSENVQGFVPPLVGFSLFWFWCMRVEGKWC
ncbi:hypothetical protein RchiOBHm_Chr7g0220321 [Rosa chinensis]|uniref:Transmembrane protein n=1 Tax=Rosa chinensis TaxID=74649 RepID=A0A2P6PCS1_ROSCH|nr:hypothetical protein RchiOBHm_Chr7g0220321 [Rosa chinensis]